MAHQHAVVILEDEDPFEQILKLAHVARPRIAAEDFGDRRLKPLDRAAVAGVVLAQEILGQHEHIVAAFAQRRNVDGNHLKTIVEVLSETVLADLGKQDLVGGGNEA